jgi:hypothetical protein
MRKDRLELSEKEHQALQELICRGENKACAMTKACILTLSAIALIMAG